MPEKERARLREQYVKELRERKHFLKSVNASRKRQTIDRALESMVDSLENVTDESTDHLTQKLNSETALSEARLEVALENQPPDEALRTSGAESTAPTSKTIGPHLRSDDAI